jgi:hypothetical protein
LSFLTLEGFSPQLYSPENGTNPRFKYYAIPSDNCKTPELFDQIGPIYSHIFPHHLVIPAAATLWRNTFQFDEGLTRVLGIDEDDVPLIQDTLWTLSGRWLSEEEKYQHCSAPHWLRPSCNHDEGLESRTGRRHPGQDSSFERSENEESDDDDDDDDDDDGPRPFFPNVPAADPDLRLQEWVQDSCQHLRAQRVSAPSSCTEELSTHWISDLSRPGDKATSR